MPAKASLLIAVVAAGSCASLSGAFVAPRSVPHRGGMVMRAQQQGEGVSRRDAVVSAGFASVLAGVALMPMVAGAADEVPLVRDKMGGLLEPYSDIAKGFKVFKPSGWNEFQGTPETYIIKWQDIINKDENVVLTSTPVKSTTTSVDALGDVKEVGEKLAKARDSELVSATARSTEGFTFYEFEFKGEKQSELYELVVGKGRLWNLSTTAATKRWAKRRDLYKNILGSFAPKL